jgi:hypothetical protein
MFDLSRKIVFTHPKKCAGTTIEVLFGWHPSECKNKNKSVYLKQFTKWKHASLDEHLNMLQILNEDISKYFVFSCIRNPWDRAVSFYNHSKYQAENYYERERAPIPNHVFDAKTMSFSGFVQKYTKRKLCSYFSSMPFFQHEGKFYTDEIIRFESIEKDINLIFKKLKLDAPTNIPHRNNSCAFVPKKHYVEYYDKASIEAIKQAFAWDINNFNYKFGE